MSVVEAVRRRNVAIVESKDARGEERTIVAVCDDKDAQNKEHQGKRVQFDELHLGSTQAGYAGWLALRQYTNGCDVFVLTR